MNVSLERVTLGCQVQHRSSACRLDVATRAGRNVACPLLLIRQVLTGSRQGVVFCFGVVCGAKNPSPVIISILRLCVYILSFFFLAPVIPVRVSMSRIIKYPSIHTGFYICCERILHYMFRPIVAIIRWYIKFEEFS